MKEVNPYTINENTPPSFESDVAKWYLISKGEKYDAWRVDKKDGTYKAFVLQERKTLKIVRVFFVLSEVFEAQSLYDKFL